MLQGKNIYFVTKNEPIASINWVFEKNDFVLSSKKMAELPSFKALKCKADLNRNGRKR